MTSETKGHSWRMWDIEVHRGSPAPVEPDARLHDIFFRSLVGTTPSERLPFTLNDLELLWAKLDDYLTEYHGAMLDVENG